jgi:6,7-dimethyl-8-ribityllumazine synthase
MPRTLEGQLDIPGGKIAIVVSRYNESITNKLLDGAVRTLVQYGVADESIEVVWVPGAFEIPLVADRLAKSGDYVAVICLGAVIRGETTHDQHINRAVSLGITEAALASGVPVAFGVLTCDTVEQAIHRAGGSVGNKGVEAAETAIRMANLLARLP